jgi:transglutaminase-like putative cysteine protease
MFPPPQPEDADDRELSKLADFRHQADLDAVDPQVVDLATRLARPHAADDWLGMVREIHRFVRDGIRYQHDPDRKQLRASSAETLERGWGNCVGKTILATALARALGMQAEIWPVWDGPIMSHVIYRVKFPGSRKAPHQQDGWLYGELTIRGVEPGQDPLVVGPRNETGQLELSGGPR